MIVLRCDLYRQIFVYMLYNKNYTKTIGKGNINMSDFKYVFGPIPSRRLGRSLGISPLPKKTCNYSCIYCQLEEPIK